MNYNAMLPNVVEMEKAVLAAMLLKDGEVIPTVTAILKEEDFYREEHRIIFRAILKLVTKKISPNALSLIEEVRSSDYSDKIENSLLFALADAGYTTAYAEIYSRKIKEKSTLRKLIAAGEEISEDAFLDQKPLTEIIDKAEKKILEITSQNESSIFESLSPILLRTFENINSAISNQGQPSGVESGFQDLDNVTNGFQPSDLILIAARPSMGKTAFALNVALQAAMKNNSVAIFSLEMSKEQLGHRLLSTYSQIDSQRLRSGDLSEDEITSIVYALEKMSDLKFFIDDTPGISVMELRSKARRLKNEQGLDLILIDYLQLMQGRESRTVDSRQQEISDISRSLKSLARELKVPVIALSQLSRGVELRAEKRPQLSDLRESGSLEQDADIVMFLYREEYYDHDTENKSLAELLVAKNRNGPTTNITLQFQKEIMRFGSYARYDEE